jgi:hypothetical protein
MKLEDLPDGERICVDANILIYHFTSLEIFPKGHEQVGTSDEKDLCVAGACPKP